MAGIAFFAANSPPKTWTAQAIGVCPLENQAPRARAMPALLQTLVAARHDRFVNDTALETEGLVRRATPPSQADCFQGGCD